MEGHREVELHAEFSLTTKRLKHNDYSELALKHFGETEDNRDGYIKTFHDKLVHCAPELLKEIPGNRDDFLLKFLRAANFDVDQACHVMKNYVNMITSGPQYFTPAFEEEMETIKAGFRTLNFSILPSRDKFKRRVYIWRPGMWNPNQMSLGEFYSCGYAMWEMISVEEESQIAGLTVVCDSTDFGFQQLRNISIADIKYLAMFVQVGGLCITLKIPVKRMLFLFSVTFIGPFSSLDS